VLYRVSHHDCTTFRGFVFEVSHQPWPWRRDRLILTAQSALLAFSTICPHSTNLSAYPSGVLSVFGSADLDSGRTAFRYTGTVCLKEQASQE
jgi:hypothetical protein